MLKVLLVEDEAPIRRGLAAMLEDMLDGFCVAGQAENGLQALQQIDRQPFHIVITDIRMPEMNGLELIRLLHLQGSGLTKIVMSGYDDYAYMRTAIQYGVADYLLKPVDRIEFAECMLRLREGILQESIASDEVNEAENAPLLIRQVIKIVDGKLAKDVTLQEIAEQLNYSYSYLSHLFKKEIGQTFSEYLTTRRLDKARKLLKTSRMKIYEIAASCGYADTKYFANLFRRAQGMTPIQYRNKAN